MAALPATIGRFISQHYRCSIPVRAVYDRAYFVGFKERSAVIDLAYSWRYNEGFGTHALLETERH